MALVSVIIPIYKVEKYLDRCIGSLLVQSFQDFEMILVDDGSPDCSGQMCDDYAMNYDNITVLHRENGGLSAARNTGLEWMYNNSKSKYVTFIDSDDWVHPQYLEALVNAAVENDVPVSVCMHQRATDVEVFDLKSKAELRNALIMSAEELLVDHEWDFNYAWGKLYDRNYFVDIRYPEGKNFEDTFTTYRVMFISNRVALVCQNLYFYFLNNEGISKAPWKSSELVIMDAMRQQMDFYKSQGFMKAYKKEMQLYVNHHAYQICRIRENKTEFNKNQSYLRSIRRDMLRMIRNNPEEFGYRMMPQCYEAAFPRIMKMYHSMGEILRGTLRR